MSSKPSGGSSSMGAASGVRMLSVRIQGKRGQSGVPLTAFFISHPGGVYSPVLAEAQIAALSEASGETGEGERDGDPHLRSMAEVLGYAISALDGEIGSVDDFLIDPECWQVRHVVVDTGNWLPGARVVLARDLLDAVSEALKSPVPSGVTLLLLTFP